jgi:hypothetical protein
MTFLRQADIFLICSRMEAFGRGTLEAMLHSKPVIGANRGGTPELVQDQQTGFLYEPGDYHDLARKIAYLCDHPEIREEFGRNGRKYAVEKFTLESTYERTLQIALMIKDQQNTSFNITSSFLLRLLENIAITSQQEEDALLRRTQNLEHALNSREKELGQIRQSRVWNSVLRYRHWRLRIVERLRQFYSLFFSPK